jgi:hypothetical protein
VRLFFGDEATQAVAELRVRHVFDVLAELRYVLGLFEIFLAKHLQKLLAVVSFEGFEEIAPAFVEGFFELAHRVLLKTAISLSGTVGPKSTPGWGPAAASCPRPGTLGTTYHLYSLEPGSIHSGFTS